MAHFRHSACYFGHMEGTSSEFLRALRGTRSQRQWSRRLGYRGNPVADWECGQRYPTAETMLRAAELAGVDLKAAFARFDSRTPLTRNADGWLLTAWLAGLRGRTPISEVAARADRSRFSVARWLNGQARPRVPDFFRLIDALTDRLPEWVAHLVDIHQVPTLLERYVAASTARSLAFEVPFSEGVLRLLETKAYRSRRRHSKGLLARALGISETEEASCLARLQTARLIEYRNGKYRIHPTHTVDTRGGQEALRSLKQHWSRVATDRIPEGRDTDFFAYNVMSLSRADLAQVRSILTAAFREIRSLVAASQPEEVAALVNLQLLVFEEREEG